MSVIVVNNAMSSIVVDDNAPRIVVLNGTDGTAARTFVQLLDVPNLYPPGPDYAVFGNSSLDGFTYRRLSPAAFVSVSFESFTAVDASGDFEGQAVFDRGYTVPGVVYSWSLSATPDIGEIVLLPGNITDEFAGDSGTYTTNLAIQDPGIVSGTYTIDSIVGGFGSYFLFYGTTGVSVVDSVPFPGGLFPTAGPQVIYTNPSFAAQHAAQITLDVASAIPSVGFSGRVVINWRGYWQPAWKWTDNSYKTAWRAYVNSNVPGLVAGLSGDPLETAYKNSYEAAVRDLYTQTYTAIKSLRPSCLVGWVGVPNQMLSQILGGTSPFDIVEARRINTQDLSWFFALVDFVAVDVTPVKYVADPVTTVDEISAAENALFTSGMVEEARRVSPDKPVFGYIQFRYGPSAGAYAQQYLNSQNLSDALSLPKAEGAYGLIVDDFFFTEYEYLFWQAYFDDTATPVIDSVIDVTPTPGASDADAVLTLTGTVDTVSATTTLRWSFRAHWGWSQLTSLTQAQIKALAGSGLYSSTPDFVDFALNGVASYAYYAQPTRWTSPNYFIDGFSGLSIDMTDLGIVSVTNAYNVTQEYRVWRSTYPTSASRLRLKME